MRWQFERTVSDRPSELYVDVQITNVAKAGLPLLEGETNRGNY